MISQIAISGVLYVIPIIFKYFTTHPPATQNAHMELVQNKVAELFDRFAVHFGRQKIAEMRAIFIDNAWLAWALLSCLPPRKPPLPLATRLVIVSSSVVGTSLLIFLSRVGVSKYLSGLAPRISEATAPSLPLIIPYDYFTNPSFGESPELTELIEKDPILNRWVCPITLRPVREAFRDPTSPGEVFEKRALYAWVGTHHTSPLTRRELTTRQIEEASTAQAFINWRIDALRRQLGDAR